MTYQSSFTGNQVDDAVGRVTNNEFGSVVSSSLDASGFPNTMDVTGNESKYLTPLLTLDPNSRYLFELDMFAVPITGSSWDGGPVIWAEGQDIETVFAGLLLGARFGYSTVASGTRTSFQVPGGLSLSSATISTSVEEILMPNLAPLSAADQPENSERQIHFRGEVLTGANPEVRLYYWAGDNGVELSFQQFNVKFTKILSDNIQALNEAAPQAQPPA